MAEPSPELTILLYSRAAFDTEERAAGILSYLTAHPRFAPERFGPHEPLKRLAPDNLPRAIELLVDRAGQQRQAGLAWSMLLLARSRPACRYRISWSQLPHVAFETSQYSIAEELVRSPALLADWIEFALGSLRLHETWYALCALGAETHDKNFSEWRSQHPRAVDPGRGVTTGRGVGLELTEGVPGIYWGNYFGPFYVNWLGRDRLDAVPCVDKRWLDTGGLFFTTAHSPFDWNTGECYQLQQAAIDHLGRDAFFDLGPVRQALARLEPIPDDVRPEQLQAPRRVPAFPFKIEPRAGKPLEEQVAEARRYFEERGFTFEGYERGTLSFRDATGGMTHISFEPERRLEYWPRG